MAGFAARAWYYMCAAHAGRDSPHYVERWLQPGNIKRDLNGSAQGSGAWHRYRLGRRVPPAQLILQLRHSIPGAWKAFHHPLWRGCDKQWLRLPQLVESLEMLHPKLQAHFVHMGVLNRPFRPHQLLTTIDTEIDDSELQDADFALDFLGLNVCFLCNDFVRHKIDVNMHVRRAIRTALPQALKHESVAAFSDELVDFLKTRTDFLSDIDARLVAMSRDTYWLGLDDDDSSDDCKTGAHRVLRHI